MQQVFTLFLYNLTSSENKLHQYSTLWPIKRTKSTQKILTQQGCPCSEIFCTSNDGIRHRGQAFDAVGDISCGVITKACGGVTDYTSTSSGLVQGDVDWNCPVDADNDRVIDCIDSNGDRQADDPNCPFNRCLGEAGNSINGCPSTRDCPVFQVDENNDGIIERFTVRSEENTFGILTECEKQYDNRNYCWQSSP